MDTPQFKIHGSERRQKKKELSELKRYIKDFWYYHQLDKDMTSIYGGTDTYPMSDEKAQILYTQKKAQIVILEDLLNVPYSV